VPLDSRTVPAAARVVEGKRRAQVPARTSPVLKQQTLCRTEIHAGIECALDAQSQLCKICAIELGSSGVHGMTRFDPRSREKNCLLQGLGSIALTSRVVVDSQPVTAAFLLHDRGEGGRRDLGRANLQKQGR